MSDVTPQSDRSPVPSPDGTTAPFWQALSEDRLVLRACEVCGSLDHPGSVACRRCESPQLGWREVAPTGTLFSWAVEARAVIEGMVPPYVVAQLTPAGCDEGGVRLVGTLLTDDPDALRLGMALRVRSSALPGSDLSVLVFEPA